MKNPSLHVVLIEDNPGDARLVRESLSGQRGITLEHHDRFEKGAARIGQGGVDVVLLDLNLPDSSGFDTLAELHERHPSVPIVVLTTMDDPDFIAEAVDAGAQDYLLKSDIGRPGSGGLLSRTLHYAADRNRILREIKQNQESLRELKSRLHNLIERTSDGVVVVGTDQRVKFVNVHAEQIFGGKADTLIGERLPFPYRADRDERVEHQGPGGRRMLLEISAVETEWHGRPAHLVAIRDVTHKPRTAEAPAA